MTPAIRSIRNRPVAVRYTLAVLFAVAALFLRELLIPLLGHENPYHTIWIAVMASAWYCGIGPSAVATSIGFFGVWYYFLPPYNTFLQPDRTEVFGLLGYLALSAVIIAIGEDNRRTLAKRQRAEDELRASDTKLRESEEQFRTFANSIPELCWMARGDGHLFWYNQRWYDYTGTEPSQMEGWGWQSVHDPEMLPSVMERWKQCIQTGEPFEMEFPIRGSDGVFNWFLTRIRPIHDTTGRVTRWFGINTNIQEQKEIREALTEASQKLEERVRERTSELNQANDSLRELSGTLLQMQDDERRRIARELHDSVGQLLAAIGMNIGMLQSQNLDPAAAKLVSETTGLLDEINRETRTISHLLHPPLLDEAGLASALRWYVEGFSQRSKIEVDMDIASDFLRLSKEMEIAIFRIVQESLTNIHRHSGSSTAVIRVVQEAGTIKVEIKDSGKGIPLARQLELSLSGRTGVGFRGMRERMRQLGGTLEIQSDDQGTAVIASLPIAQAAEQVTSRHAS